MKKTWTKPTLTAFGDVEELTQQGKRGGLFDAVNHDAGLNGDYQGS